MDQFEALLASSKTAVERWVKSRLSSSADAEDILQETYLAAFQGFSALRNPDAFLPWILGIARRKYADWYRAQARRKEILLDRLPEIAEGLPEDNAVEETLDTLPERDRLMLRLFYQEMLSQKQISMKLQIPEGTVKSRMSAARDRFRTAYPYPPKGEITMKQNHFVLPKTLPDYSIVWKNEPAFSVTCEEMMGWFIVPKLGEKLVWGMYDLPSRKLDVSYEMAVTGLASVHGLDGVSITAKVIQPQPAIPENDLMTDAVGASTGGQEEWRFIAQEKDGFTRFLSAEHIEGEKRILTTFLDGDAFMDNWGFGDDNCGSPVHLKPRGIIQRNGNVLTTKEEKAFIDVVGRCDLTLDGTLHDTVCVMDFGMYIEGIISNPIYKGVLRFGDELSPPFENLRIVSDEEFDCCEALVKGRAPERPEKPVEPIQQGSRNLLTGLIFCGYCGNRLCYSHNKTHRKLADGTEKVYDRHLYRCYRRISSPTSCEGPSAYEMDPINEAVEVAVRDYLNRISIIPREDLIALAGIREVKVAEVNYKQAVSEFNDAQRQVDALEAEALKALTGENQLDLGVVNSMLLKQKARLDAAAKKKEEAKVLLEMEKNNKKANEVQVDEILSWASRFDDASYEAKHLVIAQLVDRIEIRKNDGYDIIIHWRMTAEQFLGKKTEASA